MTLRLPHALTVSAGIHAVLLALWALLTVMRNVPPPLVEISLVTGKGTGPGQTGANVEAATPGGKHGTAVKATKPATRGQVSIATPEFVPVGRKPVRRSGEELMGTGGGEGAGPAGPVMGAGEGGAGRKIRYQEPLEYPEWAKERGVDAKVVLRFKVLPDGGVDSQIVVVKTSGWRQLDELAMHSLRHFLFDPLPAGAPQTAQWGELSFHFKPE